MFKSLQVLRTAVSVKSVAGVKVPEGTRVVVVNVKDDAGESLITARVQDPQFPELAKARVHLRPNMVAQTYRGRPAAPKA